MLALRLGRTRAELLESISADELQEWRAFDSLEPIGDWRHDLGSGVMAAALVNLHMPKGKPPLTALDFMPLHPSHREKKKLDGDAQLSLDVRTALLNATGLPFVKKAQVH